MKKYFSLLLLLVLLLYMIFQIQSGVMSFNHKKVSITGIKLDNFPNGKPILVENKDGSVASSKLVCVPITGTKLDNFPNGEPILVEK